MGMYLEIRILDSKKAEAAVRDIRAIVAGSRATPASTGGPRPGGHDPRPLR